MARRGRNYPQCLRVWRLVRRPSVWFTGGNLEQGGYRARGTGNGTRGAGRWTLDARRGAQGAGRGAQGAGRRARGAGRGAQGAGRRARGAGRGAQGAGRRARGAGRRAQGAGRRTHGTFDFAIGGHINVLSDYKETVTEKKILHGHCNHVTDMPINLVSKSHSSDSLKMQEYALPININQFKYVFCIRKVTSKLANNHYTNYTLLTCVITLQT